MERREREYILYCDESVKDGEYYSNFYGGALVPASVIHTLTARLDDAKASLNLHGEVKWQKVTDRYLPKYVSLMDAFFDEIASGRVKIRVMFRQNARKPRGLSQLQVEQSFYILYYQFIKHAFGFAHMPPYVQPTSLRVYLDQFPDTGEQVARFRGYILGLNESRTFRACGLRIRTEDFTEVRSHDHSVMQCLDIVLGAMAFRLNDRHMAIPTGKRRRAARTVAKESLYKHILSRIRAIRPGFNIGVTTGGAPAERWSQPYRHWAFLPSDHEYDPTATKGQK